PLSANRNVVVVVLETGEVVAVIVVLVVIAEHSPAPCALHCLSTVSLHARCKSPEREGRATENCCGSIIHSFGLPSPSERGWSQRSPRTSRRPVLDVVRQVEDLVGEIDLRLDDGDPVDDGDLVLGEVELRREEIDRIRPSWAGIVPDRRPRPDVARSGCATTQTRGGS